MRRWCQFSLRSLLLLVLLVATYCAGWKSSQLKHERELQEAVRKAVEEATKQQENSGDIDLSVKVSLAPDGLIDSRLKDLEEELTNLMSRMPGSPPTAAPMPHAAP